VPNPTSILNTFKFYHQTPHTKEEKSGRLMTQKDLLKMFMHVFKYRAKMWPSRVSSEWDISENEARKVLQLIKHGT